jgi:hypothetical protein
MRVELCGEPRGSESRTVDGRNGGVGSGGERAGLLSFRTRVTGCNAGAGLARIAFATYFPCMAKVVAKRPDGAALIEVPAEEAADLEIGVEVEVRRAQPVPLSEWPAPFGALTRRMPSIEIEDIKAARREALLGTLP